MKKFFLSIVAAILAVPALAQYSSGGFSLSESSVYYGLRLGMNVSTITGKYAALDLPYTVEDIRIMPADEVQAVCDLYKACGVACTVSR